MSNYFTHNLVILHNLGRRRAGAALCSKSAELASGNAQAAQSWSSHMLERCRVGGSSCSNGTMLKRHNAQAAQSWSSPMFKRHNAQTVQSWGQTLLKRRRVRGAQLLIGARPQNVGLSGPDRQLLKMWGQSIAQY